MYSDLRINEMKQEYQELTMKEKELESYLEDIRAKKTILQREIAQNQSPAMESQTFEKLYEQRMRNRT